jgi:hypothetical protein
MPDAVFLKNALQEDIMDSTEIMKILAGDRHPGMLFRYRRALGAAALIHSLSMAILFLSLAMCSCHMLLV